MIETSTLILQVVYVLNILVAGLVGVFSLFFSKPLGEQVFSGKANSSHPMKILGSFWLSVALVSSIGLFHPKAMSVLFIIQILYKGIWLLTEALPALLKGELNSLPLGIAVFFLIWVLILPFVIPYKFLFAS